MRYRATWETTAGADIAVLRDTATQAEARIAPALGNTCISFRVSDWQILDEPPDDTQLREHASSYGIPILFPWPNRLRNARFTFESREYRVPPSAGMPHANHGLVRTRAWRTLSCEARGSCAVIESEIRSTSFSDLADQYPSAFHLVVRYSLTDSELRIDAQAANVGHQRLPFGFGLHPYFRLPFGPAGRRDNCELRVPAAEIWELEEHLPTAQRRPPRGRFDLRQFQPLGRATYDDVYTALEQPFRAVLRDPANEREIVVDAGDGQFNQFVVFAPHTRSIVALEPYTCVTDALNLAKEGVQTGLRVLEPEESWTASTAIRVQRLSPADTE